MLKSLYCIDEAFYHDEDDDEDENEDEDEDEDDNADLSGGGDDADCVEARSSS